MTIVGGLDWISLGTQFPISANVKSCASLQSHLPLLIIKLWLDPYIGNFVLIWSVTQNCFMRFCH